MTPVNSFSISHIGYTPETQTLRVRFTRGDEYDYHGVTAADHARLMGAESVGQHFQAKVRTRFKSSKVGK